MAADAAVVSAAQAHEGQMNAKQAIEEVIEWMGNVENPSEDPSGWAQAVIDNLKAHGFEIVKP